MSKAGGKARPNASVGSSSKLKLDYVLTGPGDYRKTGTVTVKVEKAHPLGLSSVKLGTYRLTLARHGSTSLVADETFDVLPCVQVKASCHAVTFTNPVGNPSAYVMYRGHKKTQSFDVDVAPGTSRTVRADYSTIDYQAFGYYDSIDRAPARLGDDDVSVKQHCSTPAAQPGSNAVQSTGEIGCSDDSGLAYVGVEWSVQPSVKKASYELVDASGKKIKSGSFSGGKRKSFLLPAGTYHYRSYANKLATPFEDVTFTVLDCVQVTPVCRGIEVHNPNPVALDVSVFGYNEDDESDEGTSVDTTAAPSTTTKVAWDRTTAYVYVTAHRRRPGLALLQRLADPRPRLRRRRPPGPAELLTRPRKSYWTFVDRTVARSAQHRASSQCPSRRSSYGPWSPRGFCSMARGDPS